MTANERKLFLRTIEFGVMITLLVILLDMLGAWPMPALESFLYDFRARDCQYFTPAPTDRIVHLDIDDASLREIGSFPWPRTVLGQITDEVRLAGAKVFGMDIIFSEPQRPRLEETDDPTKPRRIEDDKTFADAIARANNVLLPLSLDTSRSQHSATYHAVVNVLLRNLELGVVEIVDKLRRTEVDGNDLVLRVKDVFPLA